MTDLVKIPHHEIANAWEQWVDFHFGIDSEEVIGRFCAFIDPGDKNEIPIDPWDSPDDPDSDIILVLSEIAVRVKALNGPYRNAYVKAWYVNNPWK